MSEAMVKGDIVSYWNKHHKIRYLGIVVKELTSSSNNERRYTCRFWNVRDKYFGRAIHLNENDLEFIGHMPKGAKWDVNDL